jgi:hypothetical protein
VQGLAGKVVLCDLPFEFDAVSAVLRHGLRSPKVWQPNLFTKKLTGTPPHLIALIQVCVVIVMLFPFGGLTELPRGAGTWGTLIVLDVV